MNSTYNVLNGGVLNLVDGAVTGAATLTINDGGTVNITGGDIGSNTSVQTGGVLNISGGDINSANPFFEGLMVQDGGMVNFTGTGFEIDGNPITLTPGAPFTVTDRDVILTGTLTDGNTINLNLEDNNFGTFLNTLTANSIVTVTIPSTVLLGDINGDGEVTFGDLPLFIGILSSNGFQEEADINGDGFVTFGDLPQFIGLL